MQKISDQPYFWLCAVEISRLIGPLPRTQGEQVVNGAGLVDVGCCGVERELIHKLRGMRFPGRAFLGCRVIRVAEVAYQ